jgi:hypothetical protein
MHKHPAPASEERSLEERTLYQVLGSPVASVATHGETSLTASKETIDGDRDNDVAALLLSRA